MKKIKLIALSKNGTVNKGRYWAIVDDQDYERLNKYNWYAVVFKKGEWGHINKIVYAQRWTEEGRLMMHRQVKGFPKGRIYFKNRNGLDCRRKNLTLIKPYYMYAEGRRKSDGESKFRGVSKYKDKWRVTYRNKKIGLKKQITLGYGKTQREGAQIYNNFVEELSKKHNMKLATNNINY